jgi:glycosyltransferase involved in cell wall biosynthesis
VAVSQGVAEYLSRFPQAARRVHVIPTGVNLDRFPDDLKPSLPADPAVVTVGFVGTLKPWHGLPTLIEAFERLHDRHPNTRLLIVGDGPARTAIETAARGVASAVQFTGAVSPDLIPGLIASMDVATAPYPASDDCYFSPLKVFEYMAAGRAVVASRIGQLTEIVDDGVTGILVAPGNTVALTEALEQLVTDPAGRARLGREARKAVAGRHTWDAVAERVFQLAVPAAAGV